MTKKPYDQRSRIYVHLVQRPGLPLTPDYPEPQLLGGSA